MIRRIIDFLTHGIWHVGEKELSTSRWWAVRQLRVIIYTAKGFGRHDTEIRSAALSFFTIMSLVPVLALIFVVFKGFGMEEAFSTYLYDLLPNYTEVVDQIVTFINNLLARTRGGIMAISAFGVLLWAVIQVFGNVEGAFNKIWEVKRSRSFARRFSVYMALVILVPILLLAANSVYVGIRRRVEVFTGTLGAEILFSVAAAAILVVMFSLVYYVLPNTDVKFKNALKAGIVAGVCFSLFQVIYVFIQGNLSSYNAIYGTFAAIPLFLLWLQISWQILLFGGELSFAMQNIGEFEMERRAAQPRRKNLLSQLTGKGIIRVAVVGDGNVAEVLGHEIARAHGIKLAGSWSRKHGRPDVLVDADVYILAVSDDAVGEVSHTLPFPPNAVVAHTAGCVAMEQISGTVVNRGVIYPLQTFTWGRRIDNFHLTPFFVEGANSYALETLRQVAEALSDSVTEMNSEKRRHLHLAGTFANNFSNAMLSLGEEIVTDIGLGFDALRPIIAETYTKALAMPSPRDAQTGAASRGDEEIMKKHLAILREEHPELVEIYKRVSEQIWKISKRS